MSPRTRGLRLKVEILSCRDLLVADSTTSDPWIKVKAGGKFVHKTSPVYKTCNPEFTASHNNAFTYECIYDELDEAGGLYFKLKDWDLGVGNDDELGWVKIRPKELCAMDGESKEFKINSPSWSSDSAGYMTIRCIDENKQKKLGKGKGESYPKGIKATDKLVFDIELMSCKKLLIGDVVSSDPYIKVMFGDKKVHQTKPILKTLNPVFKPTHGSTFAMEVNAKKFFHTIGGVRFIFMDFDVIGEHDELGDVFVDAQTIFDMHGEPTDFTINPPSNMSRKKAGTFTFRCVREGADDEDSDASSVDSDDIPEEDEQINVFVEILSCKKILIGDTFSSDPYVQVFMGKNSVHKTEVVSKTLNPKFSDKHKNTFVLSCKYGDLRAQKGVSFKVFDYDAVGDHELLGEVKIKPEIFVNLNGQTEFKLSAPIDRKFEEAGFLYLNCRKATEEESIKFKRFQFFIEILSCRRLLKGDDDSSDPYVKVMLGNKLIHKTEYISKSLNPVYSREHENWFTLDCKYDEVKEAGGLLFQVIDYDLIGSHDIIGEYMMKPQTLSKASGYPEDYKLQPPKDRQGEKAGAITLSARNATAAEMKEGERVKEATSFMGALKQSVKDTKKGMKDAAQTVSDSTGIQVNVPVGMVEDAKKTAAGDDDDDDLPKGSPRGMARGLPTQEEEEEEEEEEESSSDESSVEPVDPLVIDPVPEWVLLLAKAQGNIGPDESGETMGSEQRFKATITADDVEEARELLGTAMSRNPDILWIEFHELDISESAQDFKLAYDLSKYPNVRKICFTALTINSHLEVNPPVLETLSELEGVEEVEIRLKEQSELPHQFLPGLLKQATIKSLVLWNITLSQSRLKDVYEALKINRSLERFELWRCDLGGDSFGTLTAQMIQENHHLKSLVISNVTVSERGCIALASALKRNSVLEDFVLLSVEDGKKASVAEALVTIQNQNKSLKSLRVTYDELDYENCATVSEALRENYALKKASGGKTFRGCADADCTIM